MSIQKNSFWRQTVRASFTVEAAVICPIILLAVFTLLVNAFRLHDRVLERTALSLELSAEKHGAKAGASAAPWSGTDEKQKEPGEQVQRIMDARIYLKDDNISVTPGLLRLSGRVGEYGESVSLAGPEDILRKKVLFEEESH